MLVLNIVDFIFEIYDTTRRQQSDLDILPIILVISAIQVLMLAIFFLSRRNHRVAMYFNAISTVIVTIGVIERNIIDGRKVDSADTYICIIALVSSISILGSCQWRLLLSYLGC